MRKRVLIKAAASLAVIVLVLAAWWFAGASREQIITLPNGSSYRFVSATYGTNHIVGSRISRAVQRLPGPLASFARRVLGDRARPGFHLQTSLPDLWVWIEPLEHGQVPMRTASTVGAMLADEYGNLAGNSSSLGGSFPGLEGVEFRSMPRRSRMLDCRFFLILPSGEHIPIGSVRFSNPVYGGFPQWKPESLPAVKTAGDLEVRLQSFRLEHPAAHETIYPGNRSNLTRTFFTAPSNELQVVIELTCRSRSAPAELWTLESCEFSDATGNQVRSEKCVDLGNGRFTLGPALWLGEDAWKLKLTLKGENNARSPRQTVEFLVKPEPVK